MRPRERDDRGQALPLLVVAMAVALIAIVLLARMGSAATDAAQARTAADAAALAGAADGRAAAERLAEANGAELVGYRRLGDRVEVVVRVGPAQARAWAESVVEWVPSGGVGLGDQ